jgi:L-alanine-DL-glutamate epimerase-like enolase superfamily enzyme
LSSRRGGNDGERSCRDRLHYAVDVGGTAINTLIADDLVNLVIGINAQDYERIWSKLNRQSRRLGLGVSSMAIAALDIALWDLLGRHYKRPFYRMLGRARGRIASYISEINLGSSDTVDDLLRRVDDYRAQGFDTVKIKIG